jgi:hypothetical protein
MEETFDEWVDRQQREFDALFPTSWPKEPAWHDPLGRPSPYLRMVDTDHLKIEEDGNFAGCYRVTAEGGSVPDAPRAIWRN